jgi:gliding motility-associated-like protein
MQEDKSYSLQTLESDKRYADHYRNRITYQTKNLKSGNSNTISIPVVFHIVHDGGIENISDDWVFGAVDHLNEVFAPLDFHLEDKSIQIQFCLAQRTPDGALTSGINRVRSSITELSYQDRDDRDRLTEVASWDTRNYINIWVVREIKSNGSIDPSAYAYFPSAHGQSFDGLVHEYQTLSGTDFARGTMIHEMGHYLGLHHTFNGGCKNNDCLLDGDMVCDTPPDQYRGPVCNSSQNSCYTDSNDPSDNNPYRSVGLGGLGDQPDGNHNYMDYGNHRCGDLFTAGQALRMGHFLETRRSSLLTSLACYPPCDEDVEVAFGIPSDTMYLGESLRLNAMVTNADSLVWYLNYTYLTNSADTVIYWDEEGHYTMTLVGHSGIEGCLADTAMHTITVLCPTISNFDFNIDGFNLLTVDASIQSNSILWSLYDDNNNLLDSYNTDSLRYDFSDWGYYKICLTTEGEHCADSLCRQIEIFELGMENCDNDRDDDGDGLIDLYDPDCPCEYEAFQAQCPVNCEIQAENSEIKMSLKWISDPISDLPISNLLFGDLDRDGINEVVLSAHPSYADGVYFYLLDSRNGSIKKQKKYLNTTRNGNQYLPSVVFNYLDDAYIITADGPTGILGCYNSDLDTVWMHQVDYGATAYYKVADVNSDGVPELCSRSYIINAITGELLIDIADQLGSFRGGENVSIADLNSVNPGLEMAIGPSILGFEINNSNSQAGNSVSVLTSILPNDALYFTAHGDFNQDQNPEIMIHHRFFNRPENDSLWIYDSVNDVIISSLKTERTLGVPLISDLDNNCIPEIVVNYHDTLTKYTLDTNNELQSISIDKFEAGVSVISPTAFDLNMDGKQEVIFRDDNRLMIIDGESWTILDSFEILSGTFRSSPVVIGLDDQMNSAHILVSGYLPSEPDQYRVFCFESATEPWAPARSVWNQLAYNPTQVNDDLTIPRYPQNPAAFFDTDSCSQLTCPQPYNNYMVQATYRDQYGCPQATPAIDLVLDIVSVDCDEEGLKLTLLIGNMADKLDFDDHVLLTFYADNALTTELAKDTLQLSLASFEMSDTLEIIVPLVDDSAWLYGNINGMDANYNIRVDECDFDNNLDSIEYSYPLRSLSLGSDTSMCSESILVLNAPVGFITYLWSDGTNESSYTADHFGTHTLEVTDACGRSYVDSIMISKKELFNINIPSDTTACAYQEIRIVSDFDGEALTWFPTDVVDCIDCDAVTASVDTSQYLYVVGRTGDCFSVDSIFIEVKSSIEIDSSFNICFGESVSFFNEVLDSTGLYSYTVGSCDTIYTLDLIVEAKPDTICNEINLCFGDSILFNNIWITEDEVSFYSEPNRLGCDSIYHELRTTFSIEPILSYQDSLLCSGDSIFFDNKWLKEAGDYTEVIRSISGCDSLELNLELIVVESPEIQILDTLLCYGDSILLFNNLITENTIFDTIIFDDLRQECEVIDFSAHVEFLLAPEIIVLDTVICHGQSVVYNNQQIDTSGEFSNKITNHIGCDSIIENIKIRILPAAMIQNIDTLLCHDENIEINGQVISSDIELQSTIVNYLGCDSIVTNISVNVLPSPIEYSIDTFVCEIDLPVSLQQRDTLLNHIGCDSLYNEMIYYSHLPLDVELIEEITGIYGQEIVLNFSANKLLDIVEWDGQNLSCFDCYNPTLSVLENDTLSLFIQDEDGCDTTIQVRVILSEPVIVNTQGLYIPNIINSTSETLNCCFYLQSHESEQIIYDLAIYDRWGNEIFQGKDLKSNVKDEGWNGTKNGDLLEQGVYVYKISIKNRNNTKSYFGDVTLLR